MNQTERLTISHIIDALDELKLLDETVRDLELVQFRINAIKNALKNLLDGK